MKLVFYYLLGFYLTKSLNSYPVTQPNYSNNNNQYVSAQGIQATQYRQQYQPPQVYSQPQYISVSHQPQSRPALENDRGQGLQKYSTQIKQPIQQVLLTSNVDRQAEKVAHQNVAPYYLQQAQQQGQAQGAIAGTQRKLTSQSFRGQIQPVPQQQPQIQAQPQYLRQLPQQPQAKYVSPQAYRQQQLDKQEANEDDYDPNPSYQFGFDVNDDLYTNYQNRKEQREGNKITGSYSVVDSDGFVRTVTYTADPKEGFKAEVTRQPTDIVVKIPKPDPQYLRQQPQYVQAPQHQQQRRLPEQQNQRENVVYQYEQN